MALLACGKCKVALEGPSKPKPVDVLTCPRCGDSDTFERAFAEANEFLKDKVASEFSAGLTKAVRGSKTMKYKPASRVKREFRFIYI